MINLCNWLLFFEFVVVDLLDNIGKEYVLMFMENFKLEKNWNFFLEVYISIFEKMLVCVIIKLFIFVNFWVD